ncbi:MAG TPA: hypothetical protein DEA22_00375, partial [Blastocatellia bacterium]|nr:hypothetical protein [Blastocatellia bacterium]
METIAANQISNDSVTILPPEFIEDPSALIVAMYDEDELRFELGAWLAGIQSFLRNSNRLFAVKGSNDPSFNPMAEIRLIRAALLRCSKMNLRLMRDIAVVKEDQADKKAPAISDADDPHEQMVEFAVFLRDGIILCENFAAASDSVRPDLNAFRSIIAGRIDSLPIAGKFANNAFAVGAEFLPKNLTDLVDGKSLGFAEYY